MGLKYALIVGATAALGLTGPASAQSQVPVPTPAAQAAAAEPAATCPAGQMILLRMMTVTGTREGLSKAVADNNLFYKKNDLSTQNPQIEADVIDLDSSDGYHLSQKQVAVVQVDPHHIPADKRNADLTNFVNEYKANVSLDREILVCLKAPLTK